MTIPATEMDALKARLKATWQSGDYAQFATYLEAGALEFFNRLNLQPGIRLLDVACGAGQLAIPAAKRGIRVTGVDIAATLVQHARARAALERLEVQFDEGDAENLPYPDASFDVVMSLIGSMFAPRPEMVASEMLRVCKPGGRIVLGNWTPEGHVGQMFRVIGNHVPPAPGMPSPLLWGDEAICRQRLDGVQGIRITRYMYPLEYPFPPSAAVDFFVKYYGPANRAHDSLNDTAREALRADLTALWMRNNKATGATTRVLSEYIEVTGTRPQ
jgi:SAM-dependent methyltransferase